MTLTLNVHKGSYKTYLYFMKYNYLAKCTVLPFILFKCLRDHDIRFWRRNRLMGFTIYGHGGHLGHVTRTNYINLSGEA